MSTYSNRLQSALVLLPKIIMHDAYIGGRFQRMKITRKASNAAENLQLYRVVWFFRPRSSCTTHLMLFSERLPIYALCMMISGGRTEQHVIVGFVES